LSPEDYYKKFLETPSEQEALELHSLDQKLERAVALLDTVLRRLPHLSGTQDLEMIPKVRKAEELAKSIYFLLKG